jgi:hypothetical protein
VTLAWIVCSMTRPLPTFMGQMTQHILIGSLPGNDISKEG